MHYSFIWLFQPMMVNYRKVCNLHERYVCCTMSHGGVFFTLYCLLSNHFGANKFQCVIFFTQKLEDNISKNNIKNITSTECISISGNFTKKHLVVFDEFSGECFEVIRKTQAM